MAIFRNIKAVLSGSDYGLVIDWSFHKKKRWVSVFSPFLVEAFIEVFKPIIIDSQLAYDRHKYRLKYITSMEPGWAAPKIDYDTSLDQIVTVIVSDPHNKTDWLQQYVVNNNIDYVLSLYHSPFFYHFPSFPEEKFVHFPWAVPDKFLNDKELSVRNDLVFIFGAQRGGAYDVRNWCRSHGFVETQSFSGVENKQLNDEQYFAWMESCDAIIAAGSSSPLFDLVTPKYFEIAASGALLIGQRCEDLSRLGFDEDGMLIFDKDDFVEKILAYRKDPEKYLSRRQRGRMVVAEKHLVSHRIESLKRLFG